MRAESDVFQTTYKLSCSLIAEAFRWGGIRNGISAGVHMCKSLCHPLEKGVMYPHVEVLPKSVSRYVI